MRYRFEGVRRSTGKMVVSELDAPSEREAAARLAEIGISVQSLSRWDDGAADWQRVDDSARPAVAQSKFRCAGCGYDLTGATIGGTCPECSKPVDESLRRMTTHQRTCGMATASMVVGIVALITCGVLGPVAIGLAWSAMGQIERGGFAPASKSMADAGLTLGIISTIVLVGMFALTVAD